jgi:nucleotide-binding universal stress UspA family protein
MPTEEVSWPSALFGNIQPKRRRSQSMHKFTDKPIVVPVDLSEASDRALEFAIEMAGSTAQIVVLYVAVSYATMEPGFAYVDDEEHRRAELTMSLKERFADKKYGGIRIEIEFGDPGFKITDFAKKIGAGLIVMPSHGRTGLAHLLIGSVAERVIRYAPCPVLVLRGMRAAPGKTN